MVRLLNAFLNLAQVNTFLQMTWIQLKGDLFEAVQRSAIFPDSKTFVDATPKLANDVILQHYHAQKDELDFDLKSFVLEYFDLAKPYASSSHAPLDTSSVESYISSLWLRLRRKPEHTTAQSTLIPLKHPYIVPGGRFGEVYYWDSYFTMLGLLEDETVAQRFDIVEDMVRNFVDLQSIVGHIPNGNREYFKSRSQPPYLSLMVELLWEQKYKNEPAGLAHIQTYLTALEQEHAFWMQAERSIKLGASVLNHYWDALPTAREEAFKEDLETAAKSSGVAADVYRHLRAGAESGWDFSARWCKHPNDLSSIETCHILPVDLNCLLYKLELTLSRFYGLGNDSSKYSKYKALAEQRKLAIQETFWSDHKGFYFDYHAIRNEHSRVFSLAAVMPLFVRIASLEQATQVKDIIMSRFLHDGGLVSTLERSGQQWDAPNGWAPLHWLAIKGLSNYGFEAEAQEIALRWLGMIRLRFEQDKKLLEKYDVMNLNVHAEGGEYSVQEGFGWTNGVTLKLLKCCKDVL